MSVRAVVSGPDRAGKSTLIRDIAYALPPVQRQTIPKVYPHSHIHYVNGAYIRHWFEPVDSHLDFLPALIDDTASPDIFIWDRSWACDAVYSAVLRRPGHVLATNPWLGEWLMGRALQSTGIRVMHLGPDLATLQRRKALELDAHVTLDIDQAVERSAFEAYATRFNWRIITSETSKIIQDVVNFNQTVATPPAFAGPSDFTVLFLGQERNIRTGWLPFSSGSTTKFANYLGDHALRCAWSNVADDPIGACQQARLIVACGKIAQDYYDKHSFSAPVFKITHPAAMFRWGVHASTITSQMRQLVAAVC